MFRAGSITGLGIDSFKLLLEFEESVNTFVPNYCTIAKVIKMLHLFMFLCVLSEC